MSVLIEWLLLALCFALLVSAGVLFTQVLFSLPRSNPRRSTAPRPRIAVLIPAHDEEAVIADTLSSVMAQLCPGDRIVVVADNCFHRTESIAEQCGAEVTRRKDDERRGKGYALDHGIRYLQMSGSAPDVLIVVDADCQIGDGCLQNLSVLIAETGKAVQANDLILPSRHRRSSQTEFAAFASIVKNFVRPLGASRLGLPCSLYGTGMAFPWSTIVQARLGTSHIVEDLKLAVDMALAGEHVPILLSTAIRRRSVRLFAMALDLFVPPLALLVLLAVALLGVSALFFWITYRSDPMVGCLIAIGMSEAISLTSLFMAPLYVIGKIPLYTRFLINRQKTWIRTDRDLDVGVICSFAVAGAARSRECPTASGQ